MEKTISENYRPDVRGIIKETVREGAVQPIVKPNGLKKLWVAFKWTNGPYLFLAIIIGFIAMKWAEPIGNFVTDHAAPVIIGGAVVAGLIGFIAGPIGVILALVIYLVIVAIFVGIMSLAAALFPTLGLIVAVVAAVWLVVVIVSVASKNWPFRTQVRGPNTTEETVVVRAMFFGEHRDYLRDHATDFAHVLTTTEGRTLVSHLEKLVNTPNPSLQSIQMTVSAIQRLVSDAAEVSKTANKFAEHERYRLGKINRAMQDDETRSVLKNLNLDNEDNT